MKIIHNSNKLLVQPLSSLPSLHWFQWSHLWAIGMQWPLSQKKSPLLQRALGFPGSNSCYQARITNASTNRSKGDNACDRRQQFCNLFRSIFVNTLSCIFEAFGPAMLRKQNSKVNSISIWLNRLIWSQKHYKRYDVTSIALA